MSVKFDVEDIRLVQKELEPLIEANYSDIEIYSEKVVLDPDWTMYGMFEEMGLVKVITLRVERVLVGYYIMLLHPSLHAKGDKLGVCDSVYIDPSLRGGFTAYRLFKEAERVAREEGVSVMTMHTKTLLPFDNLLTKLGWDFVERQYSKLIK